jgi:putative oxidoreductase
MGIGSTFSLTLVIFAEFFCSLFLVLGLFTRLSVLPLIITMCVALFQVHHGEVFGKGETDALFLTSYFVLLLLGPGRVSVDSMISK